MDGKLPAGKLPTAVLAAFLDNLKHCGDDVVVAPGVGEDAAVIALDDRYVVIAMDPVTLSDSPARLAVEVNLNDIAVMGARARWILCTILLPIGSTEAAAVDVLEELREACAAHGTSLIGGHTEISGAVVRPVVVGCAIGEVDRSRLVRSSGAEPGDAVLLTGEFPLEGTGILAREFRDVLLARGVSAATVAAAAARLDERGVSVVPAVDALLAVGLPHAMHDVTEGGISGALHELAMASGVRLRVLAERLRPSPEAGVICAALGLDPLGLVGSGSLLAVMPAGGAARSLQALASAGIPANVVGYVEPGAGVVLEREGRCSPMPAFARDELARWEEQVRRPADR